MKNDSIQINNLTNLVCPHISRCINVLRGCAALGVIWGHFIYGFVLPLELNGAFWVWIFLVLSGYLVGRGFSGNRYQLNSQGFFDFLYNRSLRILPLTYIALLLGLVANVAAGVQVHNVLRQFIFFPPLNNMSLVGPLWTIATELQFYVAAWLLVSTVFLTKRYGGIGIVLAFSGLTFWVEEWAAIQIADSSVQPRTLLETLVFLQLESRCLPYARSRFHLRGF